MYKLIDSYEVPPDYPVFSIEGEKGPKKQSEITQALWDPVTVTVSSQKCVYRCMPELWLRKVYPETLFVSTGLPEK